MDHSLPFLDRGPLIRFKKITPMGQRVWIARRAVDLLQTLPEVDPDRIGSTGHSQGGGITITNAPEGQFTVTLDAADTADLLPDGRRAAFLYDVEMTLSGAVETVAAGAFVLLPDVTTA